MKNNFNETIELVNRYARVGQVMLHKDFYEHVLHHIEAFMEKHSVTFTGVEYVYSKYRDVFIIMAKFDCSHDWITQQIHTMPTVQYYLYSYKYEVVWLGMRVEFAFDSSVPLQEEDRLLFMSLGKIQRNSHTYTSESLSCNI